MYNIFPDSASAAAAAAATTKAMEKAEAAAKSDKVDAVGEESPVSDEAEKVSVLQTPYARTRTTFYGQQESQ